MKHVIKKRCLMKINTFYRNVSKKYKYTYSEQQMHANADEAIDTMYQIEVTLHRRQPILARWEGYHMAHSGRWYYAYTFEGETITVEDVCHVLNMHDKNN